MYKNIGRTLKNKSISTIIRTTITYLLAGEASLIVFLRLTDLPCTGEVLSIGLVVFGALGFWVGRDKAATIYAFGKLVDNTAMLRQKFCGEIPPVPYSYVQPTPQPPKSVAWVCPHCNTPNKNNGNFCIGCGRQRYCQSK